MVDRAGVGTVERLPSEDCDGNCNKTLHYLSIDLPLCDTFFLDVPEQICENSGSPLDRNPHCVFCAKPVGGKFLYVDDSFQTALGCFERAVRRGLSSTPHHIQPTSSVNHIAQLSDIQRRMHLSLKESESPCPP